MDPCFSFEHRVLRDIESLALLRPGSSVLVAASGGPDSTALMAVLEAISLRHGFALDIVVAHLNHRWRGAASDRDALFTLALARSLGLRAVLDECAPLERAEGNLENEARRARYDFLHRTARALGSEAVCLGHTMDDQAETVLQRLARGAGAGSLGGMRARRPDGVTRPLLGFRRAECAEYLAARRLPMVEDASNRDERFLRNRIRARVLPVLSHELGVDMTERLARLADDLQVESRLADERVQHILGSASRDLEIAAVESAGAAGPRLVHAWLSAAGVRPSGAQVDSTVALARGHRPSGRIDLRAGLRVERRYEVLVLSSQPPQEIAAAPVPWTVPGAVELSSGWRLVGEGVVRAEGDPSSCTSNEHRGLALSVDAGVVTSPLLVRPLQPGDRIRLRGGRRKLQDVLTDARIPRLERSSLAVVAKGADILWVPGIAASVIGAPGRHTREFLMLRAEHVDCRSPEAVVKTQGFRVKFA